MQRFHMSQFFDPAFCCFMKGHTCTTRFKEKLANTLKHKSKTNNYTDKISRDVIQLLENQ